MSDTFLLYIDILGFANMTRKEPRKVARTYAILDSLNVHRHESFRTIVFSDTVLVYNPRPAKSDDERNYLVWYLTEFAEDLHHRLTGQDIFFRAVLKAGNFAHYGLKNIECFFGEALIDAYLQEKKIPSIGLFIDKSCTKYNRYFRLARFDDDLSFVYLSRSLEYLNEFTAGTYPIKDAVAADVAPHIPWQVRFLHDVHKNMRAHPAPSVRAKFLTAWDFHRRRYPEMLKALEQNNFALTALAQPGAWGRESRAMQQDLRYFKRIGSGSSLSMELTKSKRGPRAIRGHQKAS